MKKYIAQLCEVARLEFTEKQYNDLEDCNVKVDRGIIPCKKIWISGEEVEYYILFPANGFKVDESEENNE